MVGTNHRTAPIEVREQFSLSGERLSAWVDGLVEQSGVSECIVLSTCHRTECYVTGTDPILLERVVREKFCAATQIGEAANRYLQITPGLDAARHLFRVASGLDSLIIGEPQIQGQVSSAYHAGDARALGPVLHRLFQSALAAGGRVRSTTAVSRGAASIPSAAIALARKVFGALESRTVLVLGTGEMGRLTMRCLRSEGVRRIYVSSRNPARAERVGRSVNGIPLERKEALERLVDMDLVVTCTDSGAAFVHPYHACGKALEGSPLVILDIALPRNVDPAVAEVPDIFLYNVDDLQRVVDQTQMTRTVERERAEAIIGRHVERYWSWHRSRQAAPVIREMRDTALALVERSLAESSPQGPRDMDAEEEVRLASRAALNKILHGLTQATRWLAEEPDGQACLSSLEPLLSTCAVSSEAMTRGIVESRLG
jgi:glutamyl-tRNA reductase